MCRDYVDEWITVEEKAIGQAIVFMVEKHHKVRKLNQFDCAVWVMLIWPQGKLYVHAYFYYANHLKQDLIFISMKSYLTSPFKCRFTAPQRCLYWSCFFFSPIAMLGRSFSNLQLYRDYQGFREESQRFHRWNPGLSRFLEKWEIVV